MKRKTYKALTASGMCDICHDESMGLMSAVTCPECLHKHYFCFNCVQAAREVGYIGKIVKESKEKCINTGEPYFFWFDKFENICPEDKQQLFNITLMREKKHGR